MELNFEGFTKKDTFEKKIALESLFYPEVSLYLNKILKDFKKFFSATGLLPNPDDYMDSTSQLLKNHYERVAKVFQNNLRSGTKEKKQFDEEEKKLKEELNEANKIIDAGIILFILNQSKKRAKNLIETNNKEILKKTKEARVNLIEEGIKDPNNEQIADKSSEMLEKTFNGRKETIVTTETQFMAESTKQIESNVMMGKKPFPTFPIIAGISLIQKEGLKEWRAVLDSRTRDAHVNADGQVRKIDEPYVVNGELLMYPGDTSLGASLVNVINCRCDSNNNIKWSL